MITELWPGVSLEEYNNWYPLTGKILVTPEQYHNTWPDVDEWFKTFALRAQNDINAYLNDILRKFDVKTFKDARIKETLADMVFLVAEHWVYNRTPIEFNTDTAMAFNNGQTQINSFVTPTINIWDLHPSRMRIWANFTQLKSIFQTYEQSGQIDANLIDLDQYYSRTETDEAIAAAIEEINISDYETKAEHDIDLTTVTEIFNARLDQQDEIISTKQDLLTDNPRDGNIKKINGLSILGTGNLTIQGGSGGINSVTSGPGISVADTTGNGDFEIALVLPTINGQNVIGQDNVDVAIPNDIKWENASLSPAAIRPKNNNYISANNLRILNVATPSIGSDAVNLNYVNLETSVGGIITLKLLFNNNYASLNTSNKTIIGAINELRNITPQWINISPSTYNKTNIADARYSKNYIFKIYTTSYSGLRNTHIFSPWDITSSTPNDRYSYPNIGTYLSHDLGINASFWQKSSDYIDLQYGDLNGTGSSGFDTTTAIQILCLNNKPIMKDGSLGLELSASEIANHTVIEYKNKKIIKEK